MKVGLLVCDHVPKEWRAEHLDYPEMFIDLFPNFKFTCYNVCNGIFPKNVKECDLYMTTGSRYSVYDDRDWLWQLKKLILEIHERKILFFGFCFGHQLLAETLGGKVEKTNNGWTVGIHEFEIINEKTWMLPMRKSLNLLMMCQDQITKLPNNAEVLVASHACPVGIMQIGQTMLGIQAHPEFSRDYIRKLIIKRRDIIGEQKAKIGLDSLRIQVHNSLIKEWLSNFAKLAQQ